MSSRHQREITANVPVLQQASSEEAFNLDPDAPFLGGTVSEYSREPSNNDNGLTRQGSAAVRPGGTTGFVGGFAAMVRRAMSNKRRQQMPLPDPYHPVQQWPMNPEAGYTHVPQQSPPTSPGRASVHSRALSQHVPSLAPSQAPSAPSSLARLQHSLHTMSPTQSPEAQQQQRPGILHDVFYQAPGPAQPLSPGAPQITSPAPSHARSGSRHNRAASLQAPSHHSSRVAVHTPGPTPASPVPSHTPSQTKSHRTAQSHHTHSRHSTVSSATTMDASNRGTHGHPPATDDDMDGTTAAGDHQTVPAAPPPTQEGGPNGASAPYPPQQQQQQQQSYTTNPDDQPEILPISSLHGTPEYASPELASDYAKMSSRSNSMHSISSVMDHIKRFLRELNELPWIADRVTVDYVPGSSKRRTASVRAIDEHSLGIPRVRSWYGEEGIMGGLPGPGGEGKRYSVRPPHHRGRSGEKNGHGKKMSIDLSSSTDDDRRSAYARATTNAHAAGAPPHTGPEGIPASTIEYLRTHRPTQYAGIMYVHDNPGYTGPPPPPTPRAPPPAASPAGTGAASAAQTTANRPQGVQLHDAPVRRTQSQTPRVTVGAELDDGLRTFPTGYVPAHRERDATAGFGEGDTHHRVGAQTT